MAYDVSSVITVYALFLFWIMEDDLRMIWLLFLTGFKNYVGAFSF